MERLEHLEQELKMAAPKIKTSWLDERRIMETSTVFVEAYIYYYEENGYSVPAFLKKSDSSPDNYYDSSTHRFTIAKEYITDAEFEGVCVGARKGKITLKDPFGDWLKIFILTGGQRNDQRYQSYCNFEINWGWEGLKDPQPQVGGDIQRLYGIIYTTSYDTDNVIGDTVTISFIESGEDFLGTLVFNDPTDTLLLNGDLEANKHISTNSGSKALNDCTVSEVLTYIWKNSQSIKRALGDNPMVNVWFGDTSDKPSNGKYSTNKIRFGDSVMDKINELIAMAEPPKALKDAQVQATKEKKSLSYSYEIISSFMEPGTQGGKPVVKKTINFDWRRYDQAENQKPEDMDLFKNANAGPIIYLKKYPNDTDTGVGSRGAMSGKLGVNVSGNDSFSRFKYAIELKIDLKNFDYVSALGKGKTDEILANYSQEDFKIIQETIEEIAKKNNNGNVDFSKFRSWGNPSIFDVSKDKIHSGFLGFGKESDEAVQKRKKLYTDFYNEITNGAEGYTNPSVEAQIKGILSNNVFNATVTVMGDPSLGTIYLPNQFYFYIDTSNLSGATSEMDFFRWMMKKVTHHLQEGKFTSSLELYSLPPQQAVTSNK
jgi:hypothetical protein